MPNPACQVKDGGGAYQATTTGVDVTPTNVVTINLIDTSADTWSIECVYTDETSDAAAVTAALTIDTALRTATFTAPAAGKTYIFRSRVNNGVGVDGRIKSSYSTTFGVYTLTAGGDRVVAANETTEGGPFGWVEPINNIIRSGPGGGGGSSSGATNALQKSDGSGGFSSGGQVDADQLDLTSRLRIASLVSGAVAGDYGAWISGGGWSVGAPLLGLGNNSYPSPWGNSGAVPFDLSLSSDIVLTGTDLTQSFLGFYYHSTPGTVSFPADVPLSTTDGAYWKIVHNAGTATLTCDVDGASGETVDVAPGEVALLWIVGADVFRIGSSLDTANGRAPQEADEIDTTDATPTNIGTAVPLASDSLTTVDVAVQCIQDGAIRAKIFNVRRSFLNNGGTVTDGSQIDLLSPEELGAPMASSVAITRTGTTVQPKVTGLASIGLRWYLIRQSMKVAAAAGLPPPNLTSITPNTGGDAGGDPVTLAGTDFVNGATVTIGGNPCTSVTWVSSTQITCNTPAGTVGAEDVVVTNPDTQSDTLAGGYTYTASYDPFASGWTIFTMDDFAGVPWEGETTAGTSAANDFTASGGTAPVAGTAVDGKIPGNYGSTAAGWLVNAADSTVFSAGAGTIVAVCKPTTGIADPANTITARGIMAADGAGVFQMGFSNAGLRCSVYDPVATAYKETPAIAAATGSWHVFASRYNGTAVQASKNASLFASNSTASAAPTLVGAAMRCGANFDGSVGFIGDIMLIATRSDAITDAEMANFYAWVKARYPSMSLP